MRRPVTTGRPHAHRSDASAIASAPAFELQGQPEAACCWISQPAGIHRGRLQWTRAGATTSRAIRSRSQTLCLNSSPCVTGEILVTACCSTGCKARTRLRDRLARQIFRASAMQSPACRPHQPRHPEASLRIVLIRTLAGLAGSPALSLHRFTGTHTRHATPAMTCRPRPSSTFLHITGLQARRLSPAGIRLYVAIDWLDVLHPSARSAARSAVKTQRRCRCLTI